MINSKSNHTLIVQLLQLVSLLFNIRSSMTKGIINNFSSLKIGDTSCPMECSENPPLDTQSHLLKCSTLVGKLTHEEKVAVKEVEFSHIYGSVKEQRGVILSRARMLDIWEEVLEGRESSLPVGTTGHEPDIISS